MCLKVVVFSAQVFLIKTVLGQCLSYIGNSYGIGNYEGFVENNYPPLYPSGCAIAKLHRPQLAIPDCGIAAASYGGSLNCQVLSPISPGCISVQSENLIQKPILVFETLPSLNAVVFEDSLLTHGSGAVTYLCGDGRVAVLEENILGPGCDSFAPGSFCKGYNSIGAGWGLGRCDINRLNSCAQSVPNVYGPSGGYSYNCNKGITCGYGY